MVNASSSVLRFFLPHFFSIYLDTYNVLSCLQTRLLYILLRVSYISPGSFLYAFAFFLTNYIAGFIYFLFTR